MLQCASLKVLVDSTVAEEGVTPRWCLSAWTTLEEGIFSKVHLQDVMAFKPKDVLLAGSSKSRLATSFANLGLMLKSHSDATSAVR